MEKNDNNNKSRFKSVVATEVVDTEETKNVNKPASAPVSARTAEVGSKTNSEAATVAEDEDEVVFAGGDDFVPTAPVEKKAPEPVKAETRPEEVDDDSETEIVFADAKAQSRTDRKPAASKKPKKKVPVGLIAVASALVCVGGIGAIIAVSMSKSTETGAETTDDPNGNGSTTVIEASKDNAVGSLPSDEPVEVSNADTTSIVFGNNVTVEGVDLSGMTLSQAYDAMQDKMLDLYEKISVTIVCDGNALTLTEADFNYDTNLPTVLVNAYHLSRGEITETELRTENVAGVTDFKVSTAINPDSVDEAIKKAADNFDIQPVDAKVTKFDPTAKEKFTFADGSNGFLVDHKELETKIKDILNQDDKTGSFTIQRTETPYKVSLADIKVNTRLIASHSTECAHSAYNSRSNMQLAMRAANGTIVNPGESFSFNKMTGDTTNGNMHHYENGTEGSYLPSTAYSQGQTVQDYGGGICWTSTTIYLCALKAGMEIEERHAHMYAASYAPYGLDATVDYWSCDMRFKNPYDYPIYMATYVHDSDGDGMQEIICEMYGPISAEFDEIVPVGWVTYAGNSSFIATGAQVYFKDGKEVKRVGTPSGSYDYHFENYYTVRNYIPANVNYGPAVSPTMKTPTVYSPQGCGSAAPVPYGHNEEYLENAKKGIVTDQVSKPAVKVTTTSEPSKKGGVEVVTGESSKPKSQESSKPEETTTPEVTNSTEETTGE